MKKIFLLINTHWPAFVVAFLACAIVILPGILGRIAAGPSYQGVYYSSNGDWLYYAARVQEFAEGHSGGNPYIYEHAEDPGVITSGAEFVLAFIIRTFHIDTITLLIIFDIISPLITTLLLYALLFRLSKSRWLASTIPLLLIVTNIWILNKAIHPQINLPILLLLIYVWFGLLSQLQQREPSQILATKLRTMYKPILLCGILLGSLYFIYLYDWSFLFVAFACSAIFALIFRRRDVAILNALIVGVSAPFAIGYLFLIQNAFSSPYYQELAARNGVYHTHLPETLPRTLVALVAIVILALLIRSANLKFDRTAIGAFGLIAANLIYPNYNVIIGTVYQIAAHWAFMPVIIFAIGAAFVYPYIKCPTGNSAQYVRIFAMCFLALFVFKTYRYAVYMSSPVTSAGINEFVNVQRYGKILEYLRTSTPENSVVLTDEQLSYFIPAFTHNYIYYHEYMYSYPANNREFIERYLLSNQFNSNVLQDENLGIGPKRDLLWQSRYRIEETAQYRILYGEDVEKPYDMEKERAYVRNIKRDLEISVGISLEGLKKYRIDYIVWDKKQNPEWSFPESGEVEQIFEANDLFIYKI